MVDWPGLQSKFQASLGLIVRSYLSLMKYFQKGKIILLVHGPFKKRGNLNLALIPWSAESGPTAPRPCSHAGDPAYGGGLGCVLYAVL